MIQINLLTKQKQTHTYRKQTYGTFLVVQWIRLRLPIWRTWVRSHGLGRFHLLRATKSVSHSY